MEAVPGTFEIDSYHTLLTTRVIGRNLIFEPSVGSTMDVARDAATHGAAEGTLVVADEQTAGRGRLDRSWVNPPGVNLASTLILRPPATALREIAMIAPLAIVASIETVAGQRADIKWPNDVVAHGARSGAPLKIAGVLIETSLSEGDGALVLLGAGVNVNWDPRDHAEIRDIATSVMVQSGHPVHRESLLAAYAASFETLYDRVIAGESVLDEWRAKLMTLGQPVLASWPGGSVEGTAEDVDADGSLLVRTAAGDIVAVEAGDVTLRREG